MDEQKAYFLFQNEVWKLALHLQLEPEILARIGQYPVFEINCGNLQLYEDLIPILVGWEALEAFFAEVRRAERGFLIINTTGMRRAVQNRLCWVAKDWGDSLLKVPRNCRIIVTGDEHEMDPELYSVLFPL